MNEARKMIIELVKEGMDKTLSEGCLVKIKGEYKTLIEVDEIGCLFKNGYSKIKNIKDVIGHYDFTAILKYIVSQGKTYVENNLIQIDSITFDYKDMEGFFDIPIKPLHLYTDEENKKVYEILVSLKKLDN